MILTKISVLHDNYIWILYNKKGSCIIIDPGVADAVITKIIQKKLNPIAILLTHEHIDHTGGVNKILKIYPNIIVFGPKEIKNNYIHEVVTGGDKISLLKKNIYVFFTPGHTLNHVSYYLKPYLFCGDTIFSCGCGKVFNNNYLDMYYSIELIKSFPKYTILCWSHEYTLSNLNFSINIIPKDKSIKKYYKKIKKKLYLKKSIFPFYLFNEKKNNIFLRTNDPSLIKELKLQSKSYFDIFKYLRIEKNNF
ncbi:Hydroxyacylglutathione hydrolase GloB [Buchnera aphidicola (Protaphis terricola)]|uniref:hydroxyacylglutathione hydrolase n=1 Tax=Buchnera aphidicola TaxID=9 RepID=UPI0034644FBF